MTYSIQLATNYGSFLMNRHDQHQPMAIVRTGRPHIDMEIQTILALVDQLPAGAVAVDAGANIGLIAVPMAARLATKAGTVLAFEPQRLIYYMLAGNVAIAGLHNCIAYQRALGAAPGQIGVPQLDPHVEQDFGRVSLASGSGGELVEVNTLDQIELPRLDFFKIDVEHMEEDVLRGAAKTIERCRPVIWIEIWPKQYATIYQWLRSRDYLMFIVDELNFCAIPREARQRFSLPMPMNEFDGLRNPLFDAALNRSEGKAVP